MMRGDISQLLYSATLVFDFEKTRDDNDDDALR